VLPGERDGRPVEEFDANEKKVLAVEGLEAYVKRLVDSYKAGRAALDFDVRVLELVE
jgi:hypothetical protein